MTSHKPAARLSWRGPDSVSEIARRLGKRQAVTLRLPASFHNSLCVRLCTDGRLHSAIDVTGDAALLRKVAAIEGLGELAELCGTVSEMAVSVRLRSPSPQLLFLHSAAKPRYEKRASRFHLTKSAPHCH